jgi:adenylate cyclase
VIVWGLLTGFVCLWWRALPGIALLTGLCLLYSVFAYFRFVSAAQWYPLIIPLFVQAPAALFAGLLWHYLDTNRERQHIRRAFGYYLPDTVVDDLARNMTDVRDDKKLVYGVCLATDAEQYTALAESLPPEQLGALMNRYYAAVFGPVRDHGGFVSDVIGDAMLAIWAGSGAEHDLRAQACRAALGIAQSVNRFNQSSDNSRLPTRLGLHAGPLLLGNVGAINHYEYRAVGDIVNTATRIQGLNKILGTRILVAQESLQGLAGFLARDVGVFLLPGKSKPIAVSELLCASEDADDSARESCALFAAALADYAARRWAQAQAGFQRLCELNPADGAAAFYLGLCERCLSAPPDSAWCATVRVETK